MTEHLAKVEARIRALHANGGRFRDALARRVAVTLQPAMRAEGTGYIQLHGDRRDVEGYARLVFEEEATARVEAFQEADDSDFVRLTLMVTRER